jgi:FlaA1/EpsC-like NDP-sugar epimerase
MGRLRDFGLTYRHPLIRIVLSIAIAGISGITAYLLRFDFQIPRAWISGAAVALLCWLVVQPLALHASGWNRIGWNRIALPDVGLLIRAVCIAASISSAVILLLGKGTVPRSVLILQAALVLMFAVSVRVVLRLVLERRERGSSTSLPLRRALIYGAGSAGQALLRELRRNPRIGYNPWTITSPSTDRSSTASRSSAMDSH